MLTPTMWAIALASRFVARPAETTTVEHARRGLREATRGPAFVLGRPPGLAAVRDEVIGGVDVRRYLPASSRGGVLAFFHGGGWTTGDLDTHDGLCRVLARDLGREVVAVHYRRAPEHLAPHAADDAEAVVAALLEHGHPVAVAGDSAGGNLAAVVARRCRDAGRRLVAQGLVYPVTDLTREHASYEAFATGYFLSAVTMRHYIRLYAPDHAQRAHPDVSPLHAQDLAALAPAYVLLAGCDVLRDEGRAYASRLAAAGVATVLDEVPGVLHGFLNMQGLAVAREATTRLTQWLEARFAEAARG